MIRNIIVVGAQWGDEGKGKLCDYLTEHGDYKVVVRAQGGSNAGHTTVIQNKKFALRLIPTGILHEGVKAVIGNGVVVNPEVLLGEMNHLKEEGIEVTPNNLYISDKANVVMPYHIRLDGLQEESRAREQIGTTRQGIGPCYVDKIKREGLRMKDLLEPEIFRDKLEQRLTKKK